MRWSYKRYSKNDEEKRRKGLTLKVLANLNEEEDDSKSLEEINEDDDVAFLSRKYQRILKACKDFGRKRDNNGRNKNRGKLGNSSPPTYFECKN